MVTEPAARRMYDADEVDGYADALRARISALQSQVDAASGASRPSELNNISEQSLDRALLLAHRAAGHTIAKAQAEAATILACASDQAEQRLAEAKQEAAQLVASARSCVQTLAGGWDDQLDQISKPPPLPPAIRSRPELTTLKPAPAVSEFASTSKARSGDTGPVSNVGADLTGRSAVTAPSRHRKHRPIVISIRSMLCLSRLFAAKTARISDRDDPFFNVELRWNEGGAKAT